jgi:hypothetical protein
MTDYRLPDVLVTKRSGVGLTVSVFCASLCSFGVFRACELKKETTQGGPVSVVAPLTHRTQVPVAMPDVTTGSVAH